MPLVYIAVHHDSIKNTKSDHDFKSLKEHQEHSDQIHVLREFSSLDDASGSLAYFSQRFHTNACVPGSSYFYQSPEQENYPIYCLDISDEEYFKKFRFELNEKQRNYLDISQLCVVGYYTTNNFARLANKAKHRLVVNKHASEENRCQFYARLAQELKMVCEFAPPKIEFKSEIFPPIQQASRIEKENEKQKARRGKITAWKVAGLITLLTLGGLLLTGVGGSLLFIFLLTTAMSSYLLYGCFVGMFLGGVALTGVGMACTSKTLVGVLRSDAEPEPTRDEILGNYTQPTSASAKVTAVSKETAMSAVATGSPTMASDQQSEAQTNAFANLTLGGN